MTGLERSTHKPVLATENIVRWVRPALVCKPFKFQLALDAFSSNDKDVLLVDRKVQHILQVRNGSKARAEDFVLCSIWSQRDWSL